MVFLGRFLKMENNDWLSRLPWPHQILECLSLSVWPCEQKDFRECLFLKRFCASKQLWKDLLSRIKPTLGFGSGFNYLKILANNRKRSNAILIHSLKKSIYRKSIKVFLNLMQASSLHFPNNPIYSFGFFILSAFSVLKFDKTDYFFNCKNYSTYAEIKSILTLVEVSVLLLFGISLAKWIWCSYWM